MLSRRHAGSRSRGLFSLPSLPSHALGRAIAENRNVATDQRRGNLNPIEVLLRGTPDEVAREAQRIVRIGYAQGGYLFNTGEMNPRDVPVANMKAMIESARRAYASERS